MNPSPPRPLKVGLILPHWTALPKGTPHWWATELPSDGPRWADVLALARQAEAAGFDSLWLFDHLLVRLAAALAQYGGEVPPSLVAADPLGLWECWSLLAALAATTERVELGTVVSCMSYRNPALLAKMVDTIEEISGGRVILGVGAGYAADEHRSFGMPWNRRVSRFEEALQIVHPLLRHGQVDFAGLYYQARGCALRPRGPRPGGPPLLIGALAHGARMLELTARYADLWNGWLVNQGADPEVVPPLRDAVDAACEAVGRDPATLGRTIAIGVAFGGRTIWGTQPLTGSPQQIAAGLHALAEEGIDHVQIWLNPMTAEGVEQLGAVLELLDRG